LSLCSMAWAPRRRPRIASARDLAEIPECCTSSVTSISPSATVGPKMLKTGPGSLRQLRSLIDLPPSPHRKSASHTTGVGGHLQCSLSGDWRRHFGYPLVEVLPCKQFSAGAI
jgi:hypothetical protein